MRMSDDELAEIEARSAAATPGPWSWSADVEEVDDVYLVAAAEAPDSGPAVEVVRACSYEHVTLVVSEADAAFIARARTDVAALIGEIRRLRKAVGAANADGGRS